MERNPEEHSSVKEIKASLRSTVLGRRDAVDPETRNTLSRDILREISSLASYRSAGTALAYVGFGSELQTGDFLRGTLDLGKTLLLPRVNRETKSLDIYEVRNLAEDLEAGTWGIHEPSPERCAPADLRIVDFVLVPGAAFDSRGGRLGYGAAFYDKLLANLRPSRTWLVAGAFEVQMVGDVPMQEHDVPVDLVVTEQRHYPPEPPHSPGR